MSTAREVVQILAWVMTFRRDPDGLLTRREGIFFGCILWIVVLNCVVQIWVQHS